MRRRCCLRYGRYNVELLVSDALQEAFLRYSSRIKTRSLGRPDGLEFLPGEEFLFDHEQGSANVHASILTDMKKARSMMRDVMSNDQMVSFGHIQEAISRASESLVAAESSSVIEIAFISTSMKDTMATSLEESVLQILPGLESVDPDIEMTMKHIGHVMKKRRFCLASRECQAKITTVHDLLRDMLAQKPPPQHLQSSTGFWKSVYDKLGLFIQVEVTSGSADASTRKSGREALEILFAKTAEKMRTKAEQVDLSELEAYHKFAFLMSSAQKSQLGDMIRACCKTRVAKNKGLGSSRKTEPVKKAKTAAQSKPKSSSVSAFFGDEESD